MANVDLIMPKLGESVVEATILKWNKKVGDSIALDETILEIATDKVDTEVPSPVEGVILEILFPEGAVVGIGKAIAVIGSAGEQPKSSPAVESSNNIEPSKPATTQPVSTAVFEESKSDRFYSPLVKNIAKEEGLTAQVLDTIPGSGKDGRLTKTDLLGWLDNRKDTPTVQSTTAPIPTAPAALSYTAPPVDKSGNVEIIEMDRMRKLIAEHMVMSKHVAPHVTSFVEADVTNMVMWRNKAKKTFEERYNEKITFTPIFIEAVVKAIKDFPMINVSLEGTQIIKKNFINIGMAAALPTGNLIVPVIKNADALNLAGITRSVNDLADRARKNQLKPDEISGGTFTISNVGSFGNVMGTPIINQPQVAILAVGAIRKKPAVIETETGDVIAIRHMMFLSLSYDHRVVDGSLGGSFLRKVADYLEGFELNREV